MFSCWDTSPVPSKGRLQTCSGWLPLLPWRRNAFPPSTALCFQAREKSPSGWSSLRALSPQPGDQLGGPHSQAKAEPHAHVCSCPLHLLRALLSLSLSVTSSAPPAAQPWVKGQARTRDTVGLFLPRLPWVCWASKGLNMRPLSAISLHISGYWYFSQQP